MTATFAWAQTGRGDPDAVTVTVSLSGDRVVADVAWPANAETLGGDYLYPTNVPLALGRALDVQDHYGFARVVVLLADVSIWEPDWGTLIALK